ncbi:hypothetical protein FRC02_007330 [Tulasnella sp. 418]|nr:hypothetical protein FRC02_007330 [Tulasnella sp. 418]
MDRERLSSMKRPQLQALAKKHNIKANLKSEELVTNLTEYYESISRSRSASEYLAQAKPRETNDAVTSVKRSTTQPSLSGGRLRMVSVVVPVRVPLNSSTVKDQTKSAAAEKPDKMQVVQEETTPGLLTRSRAKTGPPESSVTPNTRKAKETQKRLGVGRPVIIGGSGARKSTAKGKNRENNAETGSPRRKNAEETDEPRLVYQPVSSPAFAGASQLGDDPPSPTRMAALRTSLRQLDLRMSRMESALADERRKVSNLEGRVVELEASLEKANRELLKAQDSAEKAHLRVDELEGIVKPRHTPPSAENEEEIGPAAEAGTGRDQEIVRNTPDHVPSSQVEKESSPERASPIPSKMPSPIPATPPNNTVQQNTTSTPPVVATSRSSMSRAGSQPVSVPPQRLGKRARDADDSPMTTDNSASLPRSPKKKLRLDAPTTQNDGDIDMEYQEQQTPTVVDPKGKRRASSLAPASHPPRQATSVPPSFSPSKSQNPLTPPSSAGMNEPVASTSTTITASANHAENQRHVRSQSVGPTSSSVARGTSQPTRIGLATIAEVEGPFKPRKVSSKVKQRAERTWNVGRFSSGGTPLNQTSTSVTMASTTDASSSTIVSSNSNAQTNNAPEASSSNNPTAKNAPESRFIFHPLDEPVRQLVPLTTFDSGNDFYGTESKRQYQSEWHTGIVFDDAYDSEGAQQFASAIARADLTSSTGHRIEEMELEPLPLPLTMDAVDMSHNFMPGPGMDVFTEPGRVSEL